jgi:hypothetical protein
MLPIGLWQWYINITITVLHIIHCPAFYLKHDVSETGFRLRLQVETTQASPVPPEDVDIIQCPKRRVLNKRKDHAYYP